MHFYRSGPNLSLSTAMKTINELNYFVYLESNGDLLDQT